MKFIISLYSFLLCIHPLNSQVKDNVDIIVIGTGELFEDAKNNALRTALEQVSGLYLTSQTKIVNDVIQKDEINAITNGSIIKYKIINKDFLNERFILTIKATISPNAVMNYVKKSSSTSVTLNGEVYVSNMKQKELDKIAEKLALENLQEIYRNEIRKCFIYSIKSEEPITKASSNTKKEVSLNVKVTMKPNKNYNKLIDFLITNLLKVGIPKTKVDEYIRITGNRVLAYPMFHEPQLNIPRHFEIDRLGTFDYDRPNTFYLRNWFELPTIELFNFKISDGNCDWELVESPRRASSYPLDSYCTWMSNKPLLKTDRMLRGAEINNIKNAPIYAQGFLDYDIEQILSRKLWFDKNSITIKIEFVYVYEDFQNVRNFSIIER